MKWFRNLLGAAVALLAVAAQAQSSLSPTSITASPGSAKPGDVVTFAIGVSNTGDAAIGPGSTVNVRITLTNTETGYTFELTSAGTPSTLIPALTAGTPTSAPTPGTGSIDAAAQIPYQTTEAGTYRATVTLTGSSSGTAGGSFSRTETVLTVSGTPDLRITSLTYPASAFYEGGDVIPMSLTFANAPFSSVDANVPWVPGANASSFRIEVVLSSNPAFGDADDFLLTFFDVDSKINADGDEIRVSWDQLLPGNFAGSYYVLAKIDALSQVGETTSDDDFTINGNNVWYDTQGTRIGLQPTMFPTVYLVSSTGSMGSASANNYSDNPVGSADGRYTAFVSDATDLVADDTNGQRDVFLFDKETNLMRRVSVSQQGVQANGASNNPAISGDARYVAFASDATNLVFGDSNGFTDIFVVDTVSGAVTRESVANGGGQANGSSFRPAISADGRYVTFESNATNLSPLATTGVTQIYLRDRSTGTTTLVSQASGAAGNAASVQSAISGEGRYVAFASDASNLVIGDTNGVRDVFVRDVIMGLTTRVSVDSTGAQGNGPSQAPSLNRNPGDTSDGRYVAFASTASNLVASDTNGVSDVFVRDRIAGTTTRVSVSSSGVEAIDPTDPLVTGSHLGSINPSISATGRHVAFASLAYNLTPGDAAGRYSPIDANFSVDVFVRDRDVSGSGTFDTAGNTLTQMVSVNRFGFQTLRILGVPSTAASDIAPRISGDGRWVVFPTDSDGAQGLAHGATNRVSPDGNGFRDIFLFDRRLNTLPNPVPLPTVVITSPANGSSTTVNSERTLTAEATSPNGTVQSVQFFANSEPIGGPIATPPYRVQWKPASEGVFRLTAMAFDSVGAVGVSDTVVVIASLGGGDSVATGMFQGPAEAGGPEAGNFALVSARGKTAAFIGYSTTPGVNKTYFYRDIPVSPSGGYSLSDTSGSALLAGTVSDTGTNGMMGSRLTFIGQDTALLAGESGLRAGFYSGNFNGRASSTVAAILGADGSLVLYAADGSFEDAGGGGIAGKIDATGAFNFPTQRGNRFTGTIDLNTRVLTGSLTGTNGGSFTISPATDSSSSNAKITGAAVLVGEPNIRHVNGNIYDQVQLTGNSATVTADPNEVTRVSFMDLNNDITQLEFSGAGTLSITLEHASGPFPAGSYNQPGVNYMKGHAGIVITGADATTNLSIFTVGRLTAVNQSLFKDDVRYDGVADLAYVVIVSKDGKFGGLRTANASYFATSGFTGVCAPGVQFTGPVYVGDISAADTATPMLLVGSASEVRITGGDLLQSNGQPLQISGVAQLQFADGVTSHGGVLPAQYNRARIEQNGRDVAAQIVVNPGQ